MFYGVLVFVGAFLLVLHVFLMVERRLRKRLARKRAAGDMANMADE